MRSRLYERGRPHRVWQMMRHRANFWPGKRFPDGVNAHKAPLWNLTVRMNHNISIYRITPPAGGSPLGWGKCAESHRNCGADCMNGAGTHRVWQTARYRASLWPGKRLPWSKCAQRSCLELNRKGEPQHTYSSDNARLLDNRLSDGANAYKAPIWNLTVRMNHNISIYRITPACRAIASRMR